MENKIGVKDLAIKWGLILGLVMIIYTIILQMLDMGANRMAGMLSYIFIAGGYFLAFKEYKESHDGFMELGEGFKIGALASMIYGLMSSVFLYVYIKMIDDSIIQTIMDKQYEEMEAKGMPEEQIEQVMEMSSFFMTPEMIAVFGFLGTIFFGAILSIIMAALLKKNQTTIG